MQAFQKIILSRNNQKNINFYKNKIHQFSSDWTSNSWTGEAKSRHVRMSFGKVNGFSVFNRNNVNTQKRVVHLSKSNHEQKSDFPEISKQLQFLTGGKAK